MELQCEPSLPCGSNIVYSLSIARWTSRGARGRGAKYTTVVSMLFGKLSPDIIVLLELLQHCRGQQVVSCSSRWDVERGATVLLLLRGMARLLLLQLR